MTAGSSEGIATLSAATDAAPLAQTGRQVDGANSPAPSTPRHIGGNA